MSKPLRNRLSGAKLELEPGVLPESANGPEVRLNAADGKYYFWDGLAWTEFGGSAGVPQDGSSGDVLSKTGEGITDYAWVSYGKSGWSKTLNKFVSADDLDAVLGELLDFDYAKPTVSFSATGQSVLREKGAEVTATSLSATVTRTAEDITAVRFYQGANLLSEDTAPNPAGGSFNHSWTGSFKDNTTFSVQVDDTLNAPAETRAVTFNFVYPYYYGGGASGLTGSQIASLTKDIRVSTATLTRTFTTSASGVLYFAQPAAYPDLSSIKDTNNFEVLGAWTKRTVSITGLDSTSQSYTVYEFNNTLPAGTYSFTFIR